MFGTRAVAELVQALEGDEEDALRRAGRFARRRGDRRRRARARRDLAAARRRGARGDAPGPARRGPRPPAVVPPSRTRRPPKARPAPDQIAQREGWHRSARSGTLRAVIFGVSDGLVSNLALVMGVAGASADEASFILLAGIAGLLAGAFSMAAGEYISMQSQRELFERQIELERGGARGDARGGAGASSPRSTARKGFTGRGRPHRRAACSGTRRPRSTRSCARSSGLDPDELGSPWGAAGGSFARVRGRRAVIPVLPYLFGGGRRAFVVSIGLSLVALFVVGRGASASSPAAGCCSAGCARSASAPRPRA